MPLVNPLYHYEDDLLVSEGLSLDNSVFIVTNGISLVNLENNKSYHKIDTSPYLVGHFEALFTNTSDYKHVFSLRTREDGYIY